MNNLFGKLKGLITNYRPKLIVGVIAIAALSLPFVINQVLKQQDLRQRADAAPSITFNFSPASKTDIVVGGTFNVDFKVNAGTNDIGALRFKLKYDNTMLELVNLTQPTSLQSIQKNDIQGGVEITMINPNVTPVTGNAVTIVTLQFKALKAGTATVAIDSTIQATSQLSGNTYVPVSNNNNISGSYTIGSTTADANCNVTTNKPLNCACTVATECASNKCEAVLSGNNQTASKACVSPSTSPSPTLTTSPSPSTTVSPTQGADDNLLKNGALASCTTEFWEKWQLANSNPSTTFSAEREGDANSSCYLKMTCGGTAATDGSCTGTQIASVFQDIPVTTDMINHGYRFGGKFGMIEGTGTMKLVVHQTKTKGADILSSEAIDLNLNTTYNTPDKVFSGPLNADTKFLRFEMYLKTAGKFKSDDMYVKYAGSNNPTTTVTTSPTATPTQIPTITLAPGETGIKLTLSLPGISKINGENSHPLRTRRTVRVTVYDSAETTEKVAEKTGTVDFNPTTAKYEGSVGIGTTLDTGTYIIKVRMDNTLKKRLAGAISITKGKADNNTPPAELVTGDLDQNNDLGVQDFTNVMACFNHLTACTGDILILGDLDDDGVTTGDNDDMNIMQFNTINRKGD